MFLNIWNYIRGYIIIEVTGFSVERFINLLMHKGIFIWDLKRSQKGVTMKVSVKGFKLLRPCQRKTRCKIKIIKKCGLPFTLHKYRKRKFLFGGIFFLIAALYILSSFVWLIDVEGNDRVSQFEIIEASRKHGLDIGNVKFFIDRKEIEKRLMDTFSDLSWVNIEIRGTKALISVAEALDSKDIVDKSVPCNVVATNDGIITNIVTISGTPIVRQGNVVREGDILVKSEVVVLEGEMGLLTEHVHADAEVRARVYYEVNFFVPYNYEEKVYTGREKKNYGIKIFNSRVDSPIRIEFENFDISISRRQLNFTENYPLPIIIFTSYYREFDYITRTRNIEQAKEYAEIILTGRIVREFDIDKDVVDKRLHYTQEPDGLRVNAIVTTIERIDKKVPIEVIPPVELSN